MKWFERLMVRVEYCGIPVYGWQRVEILASAILNRRTISKSVDSTESQRSGKGFTRNSHPLFTLQVKMCVEIESQFAAGAACLNGVTA